MMLKIKIRRLLFFVSRSSFGARGYPFLSEPSPRPFIDAFADCGGPESIAAWRDQQVQKRQPTFAAPASPPPPPLALSGLKRAFQWLQKRCAQRATKQLRVAETVSLGEKRFVAILDVEGRKYLIGGGATNVSLLTQLNAGTEPGVPDVPASGGSGVH